MVVPNHMIEQYKCVKLTAVFAYLAKTIQHHIQFK